MNDNNSRENIFTIPNMISMTRILAIPFLIWMLNNGNHLAALILFTVASLTDLFDGIAARVLKQKSKLGALLDPAGDKLLMTAALIALSIPSFNLLNTIPLWLALSVIGRDLLIVGCAFVLYKTKNISSFPPTFLGKTSTFVQMSVLFLVMLCNTLKESSVLLNWLYILTLILTIVSGFQYYFIGIRMMKKK